MNPSETELDKGCRSGTRPISDLRYLEFLRLKFSFKKVLNLFFRKLASIFRLDGIKIPVFTKFSFLGIIDQYPP